MFILCPNTMKYKKPMFCVDLNDTHVIVLMLETQR